MLINNEYRCITPCKTGISTCLLGKFQGECKGEVLPITTVSGNGNNTSRDGPLSFAQYRNPAGLLFDGKGNLYVSTEMCLRKIRLP